MTLPAKLPASDRDARTGRACVDPGAGTEDGPGTSAELFSQGMAPGLHRGGIGMNQEIKQAWIEALRSGEYQQGRGQLRDQKGRMCCLGVLCDLHRKAGLGEWEEGWYKNETSALPKVVVDWAGLPDFNPDVGDYPIALYNDGRDGGSLRPHTFAEIAYLIEEHL